MLLCIVPMLGAKAQCVGGITTFPYVEDFETGPAWTSGGPTNSAGNVINDWAWGTPTKTVINSAASGTKCWVTGGLTGSFYAYGDRCYIMSPCFDFTNVVHPFTQFKIWWESEYKYDGSNFQYSLDNGTTWINVGTAADPTDCMDANWYNYNTISNLSAYTHSIPPSFTSVTMPSLVAGSPAATAKNGWCGNIQPSYTDTTGISGSTCQGGHGSNGWVTAKHCMPYLAGKPGVKFRFVFGAGTSCNNFNGIAIDSVAIGEGAPNTANFTYACVNTTTLSFTGTTTLCPDTFQWNFGDPGSGASNTILGAGTLTPTHTFSAPGTYNVTFTVKGGPCNGAGTISKAVHILGVTATPINVPCNGGNGSIIAVVNGATNAAPYTYAWSTAPTQTTDTAIGLPAGNYTVTVTTAGACSATASGTITQPTPLAHTSTTTPASCGAATGSGKVTETGGTAPYTYAWSNALGTADSIKNVAAGTYVLSVTDAHGCTDTVHVTITTLGATFSHTTSTTPTSCGLSNGSAKVSESGGTPPYTYNWSNALGTADSIKNVAAGSYTLTVTDAHGCTDVVTVTITNGAGVSVTPGPTTNVTCHGGNDGSITINASGGTLPYTYHWGAVTNANHTQGGFSAGTYVITVTDNSGCSATVSEAITDPPALAHNVSTVPATCGASDGSATVTESGGSPNYSYLWSGGLGTSNAINNVPAGSYTLTVTDTHGCTDIVPVSISNTGGATANVTAITNVTCPGGSNGSVTVTATGGATPYTYHWGAVTNGNNTQGGFAAGNYVITVTDNAGCIATVSANITQPAPFAHTTSSTPTTCGLNNGKGQVLESGGTPAYTYLWSNALGTADSFMNAAPGNYTLTITDSRGCTATASVTVTAITPPTASVSGHTDVSCFGGNNGSITVSVSNGTAPYSYHWGTTTTTVNTQTGFSAGTYIITVTDNNGCTTTAQATIGQPTALVVLPTVTNVSCQGGNNGSVSLAVSGGTANYSFQWTNTAQITQVITGLTANTYAVTVTDAHGCQKDTFGIVTEPSAFTINKATTPTKCSYDSTGTADITMGGATPGYTYLWSNGNITNHLTGLAARTYYVTVTDANGCTYNDSVTISAPSPIVVTPTAIAISCHNATDGNASASATGGNPGYTYLWSTTTAGSSISNKPTGTYTVTATDQTGCTASATAVISDPGAVVITPTVSPQSCANQTDGSVSLQVTGGTPAYSYQWSTACNHHPTQTGLVAGTYSYTVTDSHGCTASGSSSVTLSASIIPNPVATNPLCPPLSDGSIIVNPIGGNPGYSYTWSNASQSAVNGQLGPGNYYLTITDSRGCTQLDTFALAYTGNLSVEAGADQTIDLGQTVTLDAVASRTNDISYVWSPNYNLTCATCEAPDATPFQTTTYIIYVSDTNGCSASDSVTIFVNKTYSLYVPNAFTPNGDGNNDYFEIYGNRKSWKYVEIMIFNRWGEKVFESNDLAFQWDGRYKGQLQEPNVYVYVLDVTFIDNFSSKYKGSITLIR